MNYLVDTNVLCEPRQKKPEPKVLQWLTEHEADLYTSVLVMGEIRYGIELLPANSAKRKDLFDWYEKLLTIMSGRILSVNERVASEWGLLQAAVQAKKRTLPVVDSLIAATARRYQMTIATNNVSDFLLTGAKVINPFN
ncbi:MAG TPA: type II toxin-antitoxin system VapC family toxin [Candidatus Sulfotelmatobacter sp.]|nr:type II toxin-antitoxin system VapC family toxin [Candidatus Sulfotelmatobacter sp.]